MRWLLLAPLALAACEQVEPVAMQGARLAAQQNVLALTGGSATDPAGGPTAACLVAAATDQEARLIALAQNSAELEIYLAPVRNRPEARECIDEVMS